MEGSPTAKKRKKAAVVLPRTEKDPFQMTVDALKDILPHVASYLDVPQRIILAMVDWNLFCAVDTCCKDELDQFIVKYAGDETFKDRILQAGVQSFRLPSSLDLLVVARMTYLYKVEGPPAIQDSSYGRRATRALHPSKNRLVFPKYYSDPVSTIRVWNLATKDCVQTITELDEIKAVYLFENPTCTAVCTLVGVRVWTESGELLHEYRHHNDVWSAAKNGQTVLFSDSDEAIYSFDISSCSTRLILQIESGNDRAIVRNLGLAGVCDGTWLLVNVQIWCNEDALNGVHVFNLNSGKTDFFALTESERYIFHGSYPRVTQCADIPTIFHAWGWNDRGIDVLELNREGRLSRKFSYGFPLHSTVFPSLHSHVFTMNSSLPNLLQIWNSCDGTLQGNLAIPFGYTLDREQDSIVVNGNVVFVSPESARQVVFAYVANPRL